MKPRRGIAAIVLVALLGTLVAFVAPGCGGSKKSATAPTVTAATVTGVVHDAVAGTNLTGVSVKTSLGASTTTDANGRFTISIPANQRVRIDVTRSDYSLNQVVLQLASAGTQALTVNLIPAGTTATVTPAAGGSVTDAASGAKLTLPANFVTASGPVSVRVTGLDPTSAEVKALPGGLDAVDANGHAVYLKPVSFAEYTVTDAGGNVLQFNTSASSGANIELPIPASLRGQPGYQNGDPIECYVYDPADGKWKTPVPGVIGPSSVDGTTPAIKATIFHLSWYGGAPASSQIACVEGTVTLNGSPVANCDVEAFPGGSTRTDANGHYQVQAAANSTVRVDASLLVGTNFRTAEGSVAVPASGTTCAHLDLALGAITSGQYTVNAFLTTTQTSQPGAALTVVDGAEAMIEVGVNSTQIPVTGAKVQVGTGGTWFTLVDIGSGVYTLGTGQAGFALTSGAAYTMRFDFDNNGSWDATGTISAAGIPVLTAPANNATVGKTFTATWTDAGAGTGGYNPIYFGIVGSDTLSLDFFTRQRTYVVGNGVRDSLTYSPNTPLPAGAYSFELSTEVGPLYDALFGGTYAPNITGTNATGYLFSLGTASASAFTSTGATNRLLAVRPGTPSRAIPAHEPVAVTRARAEIQRVQALVRRRLAERKTLRAQR